MCVSQAGLSFLTERQNLRLQLFIIFHKRQQVYAMPTHPFSLTSHSPRVLLLVKASSKMVAESMSPLSIKSVYTLNTGYEIPALGFGVDESSFFHDQQ
jgi:hypothetical protein